MTFEQLFMLTTIVLGFFVVAGWIVLRVCGVRSYARSIAFGYLMFFIFLCILWFSSGPKDAQADLFWLIPIVLLLPTLILVALGWFADIQIKKRKQKEAANQASEAIGTQSEPQPQR